MVEAVRAGASMRSVAVRFDVALPTVQRWVKRAKGIALDEADWETRAGTPHKTRRTQNFKEDWVLGIRHQLRQYSDLGEFGAVAIRHREKPWGHSDLFSRRHFATDIYEAQAINFAGVVFRRKTYTLRGKTAPVISARFVLSALCCKLRG